MDERWSKGGPVLRKYCVHNENAEYSLLYSHGLGIHVVKDEPQGSLHETDQDCD